MKNAKPKREAGFRENGVITGFSGVFAKPRNAAKSGALEQESYVSGSSGSDTVQVQVLLPAPSLNSLNLFTVGKKFGLFCFIEEFESFQSGILG